MTYRAIYAYAWDLAERSLSEVAGELKGLCLDTVTLAGSYHAGKFIRPKGINGKVYFPEDGAVYFRADPTAYGRIKPVVAHLAHRHPARFQYPDACAGGGQPPGSGVGQTFGKSLPLILSRMR